MFHCCLNEASYASCSSGPLDHFKYANNETGEIFSYIYNRKIRHGGKFETEREIVKQLPLLVQIVPYLSMLTNISTFAFWRYYPS